MDRVARCPACRFELAAADGACRRCGRILAGNTPRGVRAPLRRELQESLREITIPDSASFHSMVRSPIFLFLGLLALVPLALADLRDPRQIVAGYGLWSAVLWALLFFRLFAPRDLPLWHAIGAMLFTYFVGVAVLLRFLNGRFAFLQTLEHLQQSNEPVFRWFASVVGTGIPEELCKAIPVLVVAFGMRKLVDPLHGLVLGLMSGVGFAGAENVAYVSHTTQGALQVMLQAVSTGLLDVLIDVSGSSPQAQQAAMETIKQLLQVMMLPVYNNVLRMFACPFGHACWSAIFGYFVGLAAADSRRRNGLLLVGLGLAATLHGTYNTLVAEASLFGVVVMAASFILTMSYYLKVRKLSGASQVAGGLFERTVMRSPGA